MSYFGNSGRNALKGLLAFAVFGMFIGLSLTGVLVGIVVSTPWALWYHDPKIVIWPASISMVLAWMWAGWFLFAPRLPNPFRKR